MKCSGYQGSATVLSPCRHVNLGSCAHVQWLAGSKTNHWMAECTWHRDVRASPTRVAQRLVLVQAECLLYGPASCKMPAIRFSQFCQQVGRKYMCHGTDISGMLHNYLISVGNEIECNASGLEFFESIISRNPIPVTRNRWCCISAVTPREGGGSYFFAKMEVDDLFRSKSVESLFLMGYCTGVACLEFAFHSSAV